MKLAFCLFKYYPFGGLEQSFLNILKEAISQGHEVHVYAWGWSGPHVDGMNLTLLPIKGYSNHGRSLCFVKRLSAELDSQDFDLVVGFNRMPHLDLYYCADVCFVKQAMRKHSPLYKLTPRYRIFAGFEEAVFSIKSATRIMFLSRQTKEEYQNCYGTPDGRFYELPPGINKGSIQSALTADHRAQVRLELGVAESDFLLLMVGSDFARKGVSRAIEALASLPSKVKERVTLAVIGKGKGDGLKRLSRSRGVERQVVFLGPRNDVPRFLAASDILLHLALSENTGNAIVEGLIAGLPVLASKSCGYSFHVRDARAGLVVGNPGFNQKSFNAMLADVLTDRDRLMLWSKNALSYADKVDLYSRPQEAVRLIEEMALEKSANRQVASGLC